MTIFYPMIFLSGAALPRDLLPESVRQAAVVLPLTQVVSLLQSLWMGDGWSAHVADTVVLALWACVATIVAVRSFRWE
jgi:ABC-2 type transport system permease protein